MGAYDQKLQQWKERRELIAKLHAEGLSLREIAAKLKPKISAQRVFQILEKLKKQAETA